MIPNIPSIIPMPFAQNGERQDIQDNNTVPGSADASWAVGFPPVTRINKQAGGKPPYGLDFQGIFHTLSQHLFFSQSGCVYPWVGADTTSGFPGLNYLKGSHVLGSDGEEYIALQPSGPDVPAASGGFVGPVDPVGDESGRWRPAAGSGIPSGFIGMWSGAVDQIPEGWLLCDGQNGTPDLRDRFIVGAGNAYVVETTGGAATHSHTASGSVGYTTLSIDQMPNHNHGSGQLIIQPGGGKSVWSGSGLEMPLGTYFQGGSGAHTHGLSTSIGATASLPPYYALAFIIKL